MFQKFQRRKLCVIQTFRRGNFVCSLNLWKKKLCIIQILKKGKFVLSKSSEGYLVLSKLQEKKLSVIQPFRRGTFVLSKSWGEETLCYPTLQESKLSVMQTSREESVCYPILQEKKLCVIQILKRGKFVLSKSSEGYLVLSKPSGEET